MSHMNRDTESDSDGYQVEDVTDGLLANNTNVDALEDAVPVVEHDDGSDPGAAGRNTGTKERGTGTARGRRRQRQQSERHVVSTLRDDIVIASTVLITVLLWVFFSSVEQVVGNIGIVGLLPIIVFGAFG